MTDGKIKLTSAKTKQTRELPICESIPHLLRLKQEWDYPDRTQNDLIFPGRTRDKIMTTAGLNRIIRRIASKAGIKKDLTAYSFRHSRLTDIWNKGVQGFDHNLFAGHKKGSRQTATYVKTDEEDMNAAMLEKVYHIEEIKPEERKKLQDEIIEIRKQLDLIMPLALKAQKLAAAKKV